MKKREYFTAKDHTFTICAYGKSEYIEECIKSVTTQNVRTNVIICTSTPSEYLDLLAKKYDIPLFINEERKYNSDIATDWNFAISCAKTRLVTIAHQDDLYKPDFAKEVLIHLNGTSRPLIAYTDYAELRNGKEVSNIRNLNIKRIMLFPLRPRFMWSSKFMRRRSLSFGSAICCPSVTYVPENLPKQLFIPGYKGGIDWQAWERFSKLDGEFVFVNSIQMVHRIHDDSETTALINGNTRTEEDFAMFCKFWPKPIARLIEHFYKKGEASNNL
ncbi:glycosyltransferase family A protein [Butyrivibrio sp. AD3002]|uniref:glycosyltransferase family A protein n=1 Tax=Butyrivibrio sp. AD3002 TaxID=1280670 RepID=UPI0003B3D864|nr:glycosyltransferase family A protein [Butyrivibrio sp. AD3002]